MSDYDESPQVAFGSADDENGMAVFIRVCPLCGRFVRADEGATFKGNGQPYGNNASCKKCGRVQMPFIGYP